MLAEQKICGSPGPTIRRPVITRRIAPGRTIGGVAATTSAMDELTKAREAWERYRSKRQRDAVYDYLSVVYGIVQRWQKLARTKAHSRLFMATKHQGSIRTQEPYSVVLFCTSDRALDAKTRSKWSRALRFADRSKLNPQDLTEFLKRKGGINEAARFESQSGTD